MNSKIIKFDVHDVTYENVVRHRRSQYIQVFHIPMSHSTLGITLKIYTIARPAVVNFIYSFIVHCAGHSTRIEEEVFSLNKEET